MRANHYFEIGNEHQVCQDYATSGIINDKIAYGIVSDGCSASNNSDLGARLFVLCAKKVLFRLFQIIKNINELKDNDYLGEMILNEVKQIAMQLELDLECLDCTLIIAVSDGEHTMVKMFGDGTMAVRRPSGLTCTKVEFTKGAPFYLSYGLNDARYEGYLTEFDQKAVIECRGYNSEECGLSGQVYDELNQYYYPVDKTLHRTTSWFFDQKIESVSIFSDGIDSYLKHDEDNNKRNTPVRSYDIIQRATHYNNKKGEFAVRRMKRIQKECLKDNITHYDDISIATILR